MTADNYKDILEEVCGKIKNLETIKEEDVIEIKNSVESIENLITDSQTKLNFKEIKDKLEAISYNIDSCNEAFIKNLYSDINDLKTSFSNIEQYLDNIKNNQNLALTTAEFEEFQSQQLDLALKTHENIFTELTKIKENSTTALNEETINKLSEELNNFQNNFTACIEQIMGKLDKAPDLDSISSVISDLNSVQQNSLSKTNDLIKDIQTNLSESSFDININDLTTQLSQISEIYSDLQIIKQWTENAVSINKSIENIEAEPSEFSNNVDVVNDIKSQLELSDSNFEKIKDDINIVCESITELNSALVQIENLDENLNEIKTQIDSNSNFIQTISGKVSLIYDNISDISDWAEKLDVVDDSVAEIKNKFNDISYQLTGAINPIRTYLMDVIPENVDMEDVSNKVDLIYENTLLLNNWANKVDTIIAANAQLDDKISEIKQTVTPVEDIPELKTTVENVSMGLADFNSDISSLKEQFSGFEADFSKICESVDISKQSTAQDILSVKERLAELNDDVSSISIRTNKLILSADDANKEFKNHLNEFKNTVNELALTKTKNDNDVRFVVLGEKLNKMTALLQNNITTNNNLNNAFMYLAEWVDATGNVLNTIQNDVANVQTALNKIEELESVINTFKTDDFSELKSIVTGIIVQLNTALSPDIDSITEKIDNTKEENTQKLNDLSNEINKKIEQQAKQINALETKMDNLDSKLDKLMEMISEAPKTDVQDKLNYIVSEMTTAVDTMKNIKSIETKVNDFSENINKIVAYIEDTEEEEF